MGRNESLCSCRERLGWQMTAAGRRSYFTFSLAVKEDEAITPLEWQLAPSWSEEGRRLQMMRRLFLPLTGPARR